MLAVSLVIFSASAQKPEKTGKMMMHHNHHHPGGMAFKNLNLTDAQKQQMKADHESFKKQMQELDKNDNMTVKEYREKKDALHKAQKEKMMSMLTPEQKNQLEQNKKSRLAEREARDAKRMEKMKTNLGLTDDQVAKIKTSRESIRTQMNAIREDDKLSSTEKKEKLMALKEQHKNSIKQYLTPEQISKMEEMKKMKADKKPAR